MLRIQATRAWLNDTIDVTHDAAARTISGPDAARVEATLARWDGVGILYGTQPVEAPDPRGSLRDFAVVLADAGFDLPDAMAEMLPFAEAVPDGAVA